MKIIKKDRNEYKSYINQTDIYDKTLYCSECGRFIARTYGEMDILPDYKYCPYCGQVLDWRECDG